MAASGGVGAIIGFAHDWANPENKPAAAGTWWRATWCREINGYLDGLRKSQKFVIENRAVFERAGQAIMAKIMETKKPPQPFRSPAPDVWRSPPSMRRTCRRKRRNGRREGWPHVLHR